MKYIEEFFKEEDGAVTVDWIVMTAAVVALAIFLISIIRAAAVSEVGTWF